MGFTFEVGEIVKVKKLHDIKRNSGPGFVDEMKRFIGKEIKIDARHYSSFRRPEDEIYTIEGWNWKAEWLKRVEFFNDNDFEI